MDKETWKRHLETSTGLTRPSRGGNLDAWRAATREHLAAGCRECKARAKTMQRNRYQRMRDQALRDIGLHKVIGPVSGKVYWE